MTPVRFTIRAAAFAVTAAIAAVPALAADVKGTAPEATAMVGKAVALIKAQGAETAFAAFTAKDPRFVDRDLYVVAYSHDGRCLAHGSNPKLVGKDLIENQDTDGKFYIKERVDLAQSKTSFWQDYKFSNPVTKKVEPKTTYCEVVPEAIVCVGIYK
jgi:signal transduction histidine kinase